MNGTHQLEPTSTDRLLTYLGLAIDEANLVRKEEDHPGEGSDAQGALK